MVDQILASRIEASYAEVNAFAQKTSLLDVNRIAEAVFEFRFRCRTMVWIAGKVTEADETSVEVRIPPNYLKETLSSFAVLRVCRLDLFNPHILGPVICLGPINADSLLQLAYRIHAVLVLRNVATNDPLNANAADWVREQKTAHPDAIPVDRRPLMWRPEKETS